jgi:hypothetical protein
LIDKTKWKVDDYVADLTKGATGQNLQVEAKLLKKYPPIFSPIIYQMEPCCVQDEDGNILMWYIPGALLEHRAVSFVRCFILGGGPRLAFDLTRHKFGKTWKMFNNQFISRKIATVGAWHQIFSEQKMDGGSLEVQAWPLLGFNKPMR